MEFLIETFYRTGLVETRPPLRTRKKQGMPEATIPPYLQPPNCGSVSSRISEQKRVPQKIEQVSEKTLSLLLVDIFWFEMHQHSYNEKIHPHIRTYVQNIRQKPWFRSIA
jgi:hypothetical protein